MKKYIKDGVVKTRNQIVIRKNGKNIYNPNEKMILEDGWVEYVIPEPTEEELLIISKKVKKLGIQRYEESLKGFFIGEEEININADYLNKVTFRVMAELAMNKNKTTLKFNGKTFEMKTKDAMDLLYNVQIYYGELFDISESHKNSIEDLGNKEDVETYVFEDSYPQKPRF